MGIVFPTEMVVRSLVGRNFAGMIDKFEHGHPLLRRPLVESLAEWENVAARPEGSGTRELPRAFTHRAVTTPGCGIAACASRQSSRSQPGPRPSSA